MAKGVAHAGKGKSLSSGEAHENERRGWTEDSYRRKNRQPMNNYDWSRHGLNFEIVDGEVIPLGSQETSLYKRYQNTIKNIDFIGYKAGATNQQHTYVELILSGSTDRMQKIAFAEQNVNYERNPETWHNWGVTRTKDIEEWALDVYRFACRQYGKENVIGFEVHLDETEPHIHCNIVPTAVKKQRGNVSGYVKVDVDGTPARYTKGKHIGEVIKISDKKYEALSDEKKKEYRKNERGTVHTISYATYFGRTLEERSKKLSELHDEFYRQVGSKWGFDRGDVWALLPDEEKRKRGHRTKRQAYEEQQANTAKDAAVKEAQQQQAVVDENAKTIEKLDNEVSRLATVIQGMKDEEARLDDAIAEKKEEQQRLGNETWLDAMKGLVNKSDKDKKYLKEIEKLEKEALAVDENGNPVLYKSGNQASWKRYAELLRSRIQEERAKLKPAVDAAVCSERDRADRQIASLKEQIAEKDGQIARLEAENKTLIDRIKAIKEGFLNFFGPKFRAAVAAIVERFDNGQERFNRHQKGTIETSMATKFSVDGRRSLGSDAVDAAKVIAETKEKWTEISTEVDEIAENRWETNQERFEKREMLSAAVDAVVSMSRTPTKKVFSDMDERAISAYLANGGSVDEIWNAAKNNLGAWGAYAERELRGYVDGTGRRDTNAIGRK